MENLSKMTIDDSSTSMYFSFNSTTAYKTVDALESGAEISCIVDEEEDAEQNITLEADEEKPDVGEQQLHTVKKLSFDVSSMTAIPKNVLKAYKALSSTPTKAQLLRSVEVNRGSSSAVGISDLGLAFLEAPQESIKVVLSEDKENQPQESQEIYSESSSENVVSVIEKTQEEMKPVGKRVGFSNLPVLKGSGNSNIRGTPKLPRAMARCEPDLVANRPSRIASKRMSIASKYSNDADKEFTADELPKMISSILKISKEMSLPTKRKSFGNPEKPFSLIGKATRMSIVKTTLNSPARKLSRKSIVSAQVGRNTMRQSMVPINKRKSIAPVAASGPPRRSVMPMNTRKSMLPTTVTSPKKRIIPMNPRKSLIQPKSTTSHFIPTSRQSMAPKPSTSTAPESQEPLAKLVKIRKPPGGLKEEYVCEVCSRKFRVLSLFEAHKRTHGATVTSTKQTFSDSDKQCRYCDKKFAISKALSNHLIQNCTKIPPGDKKKLLFPPMGQPQQTANSKMLQKSVSIRSSCDSLASNSTQHSQHIQQEAKNSSDTTDGSMPPPSINKIKKKLAHSGVYCTPNKLIPCHVCKISFSNILDYTEHSLSHSTDDEALPRIESTTQTQDVELKTEATQTLPDVGVPTLN